MYNYALLFSVFYYTPYFRVLDTAIPESSKGTLCGDSESSVCIQDKVMHLLVLLRGSFYQSNAFLILRF